MNAPCEFAVVIPARYASTRFPGKALHKLNGVPMILHTAKRAKESSCKTLIVATDDERIVEVCKAAGIDVELTRADHPSGTDRIAEVADIRRWPDDLIIVGLQGDEPATPADHLNTLAGSLTTRPHADMATLRMPITDRADYISPHRVKVVCDRQGRALYFSRAAIPAYREALINDGDAAAVAEAFMHVGLYAYRRSYLRHYQDLAPCVLETTEQLEQLRVLYDGGHIHCEVVPFSTARGVDHPEDVPVLERLLSQSFSH